MKKTLTTIAILLGIALCATAQQTGGGIFERGYVSEEASNPRSGESLLSLPGSHGSNTDTDAPLGGGIAVLLGFGATYAMKRRNKK